MYHQSGFEHSAYFKIIKWRKKEEKSMILKIIIDDSTLDYHKG